MSGNPRANIFVLFLPKRCAGHVSNSSSSSSSHYSYQGHAFCMSTIRRKGFISCGHKFPTEHLLSKMNLRAEWPQKSHWGLFLRGPAWAVLYEHERFQSLYWKLFIALVRDVVLHWLSLAKQEYILYTTQKQTYFFII